MSAPRPLVELWFVGDGWALTAVTGDAQPLPRPYAHHPYRHRHYVLGRTARPDTVRQSSCPIYPDVGPGPTVWCPTENTYARPAAGFRYSQPTHLQHALQRALVRQQLVGGEAKVLQERAEGAATGAGFAMSGRGTYVVQSKNMEQLCMVLQGGAREGQTFRVADRASRG